MSLTETAQLLGNFGEFVGAMAVVVTLAYLAIQIRQGSKSSRAAAVATLLTQYDSPNSLMAGSNDAARVFRLGTEGGEALDRDEFIQFQCLMSQYFSAIHTAFHFNRDGILSNEQWLVYRRDLLQYKDLPGVSALMPYYRSYFAPDPAFVRELDQILGEQFDRNSPTFMGAFGGK